MNNQKKIYKRLKNVTETTDPQTGEFKNISKEYSIEVESADFYFTFIEAISFMQNIKGEFPVLALLCINSEFNTGRCLLPAAIRKEYADSLGLSIKGFNSAISRLCKKGAIKNNGGIIEINPLYLWKGSVAERNKLLKEQGLELKIKFNSNDTSL